MSARRFLREATRTHGLARHDRCCCHPRAWGLKKGLRRARRRLGRELARQSLPEASA